MNILLISQNFYPELGSGAHRMKSIFKLLSQHHHVDVLTTYPSYPNKKLFDDHRLYNDYELNQSEHRHIYRMKTKLNKQSSNLYIRLFYYFELMLYVHSFVQRNEHKYDAIYVTSPNIFMPWSAMFFQSKIVHKKIILEIRDLWPDSVKEVDLFKKIPIFGLLKLLEKKMYKTANKIVVNNKEFITHIENIDSSKPKKNTVYIPNGLLFEELNQQLHKTKDVIYTGNIGYAQNVEQICQLLKELNSLKIKVTLVPYGTKAQVVREYVKINQLVHIEIKGQMSRISALNELNKHKLSLSLLKETDTFERVLPGKIIDSLSQSTPVITNLKGINGEMISKNELGILTHGKSMKEIALEVEELLKDTERLESMQRNSYQYVEEYFVWENNFHLFNQFVTGEMDRRKL